MTIKILHLICKLKIPNYKNIKHKDIILKAL